MRAGIPVFLAGVLMVVSGCGKDAPPGSAADSVIAEGTGFTGVVRYHDAAPGSMSGPTGYVLEGDHMTQLERLLADAGMSKTEREEYAMLGATRLYLRMKGSLSGDAMKEYLGKTVRLTGTFDVLHVHGMGSPHEHLPVIDVTQVEVVPGG